MDCKMSNPKDLIGVTKLPLHLIPDTALAQLALALHEGSTKYGPYNWRSIGVATTVYVAAARRHLAAWFNGEETDPDSGTHHLGHAMACLAIILDSQAIGNLKDDRPPAAPVGPLQRKLSEDVRRISAKNRPVEVGYEVKVTGWNDPPKPSPPVPPIYNPDGSCVAVKGIPIPSLPQVQHLHPYEQVLMEVRATQVDPVRRCVYCGTPGCKNQCRDRPLCELCSVSGCQGGCNRD